MGKSRNAKDKVRATAREAEALKLRTQGLTYEEIAKAMKVSYATAHRAVHRGLERAKEESREAAEELREIHFRRLEKSVASLWPKVEAGDTGAIQTMIKALKRQADMFGLDVVEPETGPTELTVTFKDDD